MDKDVSDESIEKALKMEIEYYQNSIDEAIDNISHSLKVDPERVRSIAAKITNK